MKIISLESYLFFYSNDYEFDIKNQKIYIYIYTETELNNDTLNELVFGDKGYWETTSRQTIYYGEVIDNDYYEMPYRDSYEATLSLIISDAEVEELEKGLNEVYPNKNEGLFDRYALSEDIKEIEDPKKTTFQNQIDKMKGDIKITLYESENGHNYASEYLRELYRENKKLCAKMMANIQVFKEMGRNTPEKYSKYLKNGILEIRASEATNESRELYFFAIGGNEIVITNGFTKKTQRTPEKEIKKAMNLRDEYFRRGEY